MSVVSEYQQIYAVGCDGCYRRARLAFHRVAAIGYAKQQGYIRHVLTHAPHLDAIWLCRKCSKPEAMKKALEAYTVRSSGPAKTPPPLKPAFPPKVPPVAPPAKTPTPSKS